MHTTHAGEQRPLAGDKMDVPTACAVPFRPYSVGVVTRTQNVIEYMLVLALCLFIFATVLTVVDEELYLIEFSKLLSKLKVDFR